MKTCFSAGKLMKQFGNPPFLKEPLLLTNPLFLSNFFMTPFFVQILKTRNPPPPPNFREGEETMRLYHYHCYFHPSESLSQSETSTDFINKIKRSRNIDCSCLVICK